LDLSVFHHLPDELDALVPAQGAALALSSARSAALDSAAATAFEVAWLERPALGPLYGGESEPRLSSRLLLVVRRLFERMAPRGSDAPESAFDALRSLLKDDGADVEALGILVDAIGILPVGSVVELDAGEWAVVAPSATTPSADHPILRFLTDREGRPHPRALLRDPRLAVSIARVLGPRETRFNVARAFFLSQNDAISDT
jgi:hypothetical protein